jgi:hypothetical protein
MFCHAVACGITPAILGFAFSTLNFWTGPPSVLSEGLWLGSDDILAHLL